MVTPNITPWPHQKRYCQKLGCVVQTFNDGDVVRCRRTQGVGLEWGGGQGVLAPWPGPHQPLAVLLRSCSTCWTAVNGRLTAAS